MMESVSATRQFVTTSWTVWMDLMRMIAVSVHGLFNGFVVYVIQLICKLVVKSAFENLITFFIYFISYIILVGNSYLTILNMFIYSGVYYFSFY